MRFIGMISILFFLFLSAMPEGHAVYQPKQFAIKSQSDVTATTVSTSVAAAEPSRGYLLIQNKGAVNVYLKFGSAHSGTEGILIVPGGNWEPPQVPTDAIYLKSASSTAVVQILEGYL